MAALPTIDGHRVRPLVESDHLAVVDLIMAVETAVDGQPTISAEDLTAAWARPGFDLKTMSIGVEGDGRLVACGEVFGDRAEVAVHPSAWGRGIGMHLAKWTWRVAADLHWREIGQTISDKNRGARHLFESLGYRNRWRSWVLRKSISDHQEPLVLPGDVSVRPMIRPDDDRTVFEIIDTAFSEWPDRTGWPFEDWRAAKLDHESARPSMSVVLEVDGQPVGAGLAFEYDDDMNEGWIEQIAVARQHRERGLGGILLRQMFQNFAAAGYPKVGLSTDSRTGALGLYEHVGMSVTGTYTRWSKTLD